MPKLTFNPQKKFISLIIDQFAAFFLSLNNYRATPPIPDTCQDSFRPSP
jgi:hypothetical protein